MPPRLAVFAVALLLPLVIGAGPTTRPHPWTGPVPTIEPTGPLRIAQYTRAFAPPTNAPLGQYRDSNGRYVYGTPAPCGPYFCYPYCYGYWNGCYGGYWSRCYPYYTGPWFPDY
jgi:hypothetical protein